MQKRCQNFSSIYTTSAEKVNKLAPNDACMTERNGKVQYVMKSQDIREIMCKYLD